MSESLSSASRRLHGVLVADMTGFSRMMGEDESAAVDSLACIRQVFSAVVPRHGGTLDVLVGDCFVALFDSAVEAVKAAVAIQAELAGTRTSSGHTPQIRIGIHIGDVMRSGSEIFGDSVNIAARLQATAHPGGTAVSEDVYRAVRNRVDLPFRDLGPTSLKNIREKIRIYELHGGGEPPRPRSSRLLPLAAALRLVLALSAVAYRRLVPADASRVEPAPRIAMQAAPPQASITVGVTGVTARGNVPQWIQDSTRDGLNTLLSKVASLRVFSREKIDFLRQRKGLSEIEVAETLGIQKMISGSLDGDGEHVVMEVRVVDTGSGILEASESASGPADELIELQNKLAAEVFSALGVELSSADRERLFARRTSESLDAYRRLADTFGEAPAVDVPRPDKTSWFRWASPVFAEDPPVDDTEIRALLEAYRRALEEKNVEAVAATHVELSPEQRAGFERYFAGAEDLKVTLTDIDILLAGEDALATFTRRDSFHDRKSGNPVELEVRLSSEVVRKDGRWLLRGVKRSS